MNLSNFKLILQEELNHKEKAQVDKWAWGKNNFSDHVFKDSPDHYRRQFDLVDPQKSDHEDKIRDHLSQHGIQVNDYKAGNAIDKHGRTVSIGRALEKTKAPDHLKKGFQNDPARAQKNKSGLKVNLSRHPYDVAGMTSKGHSWENESCMNFSNGSNNKFLRQDVKHGTHVAYLAEENDKTNKHPLARIALKKYTNIDNKRDHILRPENRTYGNAPDQFHHTVNRIVNDHFPGKEDAIYKKNENVYNDTRNTYIIGKHALDKAINHHDDNIKEAAAESEHLEPKHIHKLLDSDNFVIRRSAARHPNASKENIDKAFEDEDGNVRRAAMNNPNLSKEHLDKAIVHGSSDFSRGAAIHKNATPEHLEKGVKSKDRITQEFAARNPNATHEQISKFLKSKSEDVREGAARNPSATSEHIDKALDDVNSAVRAAAAKNRNATSEHLHKALNDKHTLVKDYALTHENLKPDHIDKALNDEDFNIRRAAISHKNASSENLHKALDDENRSVRTTALEHKNITSEHLDKALDDKDFNVRIDAVSHKNVTYHHLHKALNDKDADVRRIAKRRIKDDDYAD